MNIGACPPQLRTAARNVAGVCVLGLMLSAAGGCSIKRMAVDRLADALGDGGSVYAVDDDPELVGAAVPFGLKILETLLAETPSHRGVLLALARGFTQYAYAWVHVPADELEGSDVIAAYAQRDRARRLYLRARDYGLRGLEAGASGFAQRLRFDPSAAAAQLGRDDVAFAYWSSVSWAAAISLGKDDPSLLAGLPAVQALIYRALELDEAYADGAIHTFLISFEMSRPGVSLEQKMDRARRHFDRAVVLSGGQLAGPYLAFAEASAAAAGNRAAFEASLAQALAIDPDARLEWRLANLISQRRARWLQGRVDHFFTE